MIARLWCQEIIAEHKKYHEAPAKLKPAIRNLLIEAGRPDLIDE